jgi:membrane-associated phospholipid phosphatase
MEMAITQTLQSSSSSSFLKRLQLLASGLRKEVVILYGLFFFISVVCMLLYDKCILHRILNNWNAPFLDPFFKYSTHLGDGMAFGALILVFAFIKRRMILVVILSGVLTFLVTYLFKKILFHGSYRPAMHMGADTLHWVEGVKVAFWGTFPSGHTITIFALATVLCLYFRKSKLQYLWIALALIVAYSRVYLSMHFLQDIFVGSIFGIFIGFLSMALLSKVPVEKVS